MKNAINQNLNTNEIDMAMMIGQKAFNSGLKCIPCHDENLMELMKSSKLKAILLIDAWLKAWHKENLRN